MKEPANEPSLREVSDKVDAVVVGLRWLLLAMMILSSIINYWLAVFIPKFDELFRDALPGKPLPLLTLLVVHGASFFVFLAPVWLVLGISILKMAKKPKVWVLGAVAILFLIVLQILGTLIACLTPIFGLVSGLP